MGKDLMDRLPNGETGGLVDDQRFNLGDRFWHHFPRQRREGEKRGSECQHDHTPQAKETSRDKGSERMRLPVRAKIAFARAGMAGGVPISPIPPILW